MANTVFETRVKEIVTRETVTVDVTDTIHEALVLMGENRVTALPVVDRHQRCIGILSAADLIDLTRETDDDLRDLDVVDLSTKRFLIDKLALSLGNEKIQLFMSDSPETVDMETSITAAAEKMLRNHVHHLPVVDSDGRLIGIISTMDLLMEFVSAAPEN